MGRQLQPTATVRSETNIEIDCYNMADIPTAAIGLCWRYTGFGRLGYDSSLDILDGAPDGRLEMKASI